MSIRFFVFLILFLVSLQSTMAKKKNLPAVTPEEVVLLKTTVEAHGGNLATIQNQMGEVVSGFQGVSGEVARVGKQNLEHQRQLTDIQIRLQSLEDKITILVQQLTEIRSAGLGSAKTTEKLKEYAEYTKGLELLNAKQFDKAISEFQKFQTTHKKSAYSASANFWIGEARYLQGDYPLAIKEYQKLLSANSKSDRAPSALYRQGLAFYHLQSLDDAKAFFAKLIKTYPQSIEASQAVYQVSRIDSILEQKRQHEAQLRLAN